MLLPEDVNFTGQGNPLRKLQAEFVEHHLPEVRRPGAQRETDTMDTFIDRSWYFIRYCSPGDDKGCSTRRKRD